MGCSGPHSFARLPPGAQGGQDALLVWDTPSTLAIQFYLGAPGQSRAPARAGPQGWHRPGPQLPPSFKSPTPAPGAAWKLGAGENGARPSPALCVPNPADPGPRAAGSALPGPGPGAAMSRSRARARPDPLALTVAPRRVLQVGACQGCRRPGRPGARGSAERAYDPQVASHPEQARERTRQARSERRPQLPAAWQRAAQTWALGARARPGRGRRGRQPIGPRRD